MSLEALIVITLMLFCIGTLLIKVYGYVYLREACEDAVYQILAHDHHELSHSDFLLAGGAVELTENFELKALTVSVRLPYVRSAFLQASEEVVFITDTGCKYHRPGCPTVSLSLRPILKKNAGGYEPCSVCCP